MFKLMDKKIIAIFAQNFCLTGPMCISVISNSEMEVLTSCAKPFIDSDSTMVQEWRKTEE